MTPKIIPTACFHNALIKRNPPVHKFKLNIMEKRRDKQSVKFNLHKMHKSVIRSIATDFIK